MEWQQLEYFQTLARVQHVTRAAESVCITQPALSRSISRLEEELGVPLFDRQGRAITLNRYGQLFLKRVDRMLMEFNAGKQELHDLVHPEYGEIALGFFHTLSTSLIPDLISAFRTQFPRIGFQLSQNQSYSLLGQLNAGELDICLIAEPTATKIPIQWIPLWTEEIYVTLPLEHPLVSAKDIVLAEIAQESFIFLKKGYTLRDTTDRVFQQQGIRPTIAFEGEEVAIAAGLVAAGLGVSLLPNTGFDRSKIVQIPLRAPKCQRVIGLALIEGRYVSPVTSRFKQFVMEHFHRMDSI